MKWGARIFVAIVLTGIFYWLHPMAGYVVLGLFVITAMVDVRRARRRP